MAQPTRMVRGLLLFEAAMYSSVTPVLPHYAHTLHASKAAVGLLAAGYSAGLIPGALLGGRFATRHGVRRTTLAGLIGFGLAIAGFGLVSDLAALDALRVVQGMFCGLIWGGGLTWVIAAAPVQRRGTVIAGVMAAATLGTLIGPLLGTLALAIGTVPVFGATGAASLVLAGWAARHPEPAWRPPTGAIGDQLRRALHSDGFALGTWLVALEAIYFGAAGVLLPLRMAHLGAPGWEIGAAFAAASAVSAALAPLVGRSVDRRGARLTITFGLATGAPLLVALLAPTDPTVLAGLLVISLGVPMTAGMIPAVSLMTAATERAGVSLVLATTAVNLGYAVGETLGAPTAAALGQTAGDGLPLFILAALMLASLVPVRRAPSGAESAEPAPDPHAPGRTHARGRRRTRRGDRSVTRSR